LGATKAFFWKLRLDANMFRRQANNYADDSQILSTGIRFPIAFDHAILYGAEGKLQLLQWKGSQASPAAPTSSGMLGFP
jgi:hypothetical protein